MTERDEVALRIIRAISRRRLLRLNYHCYSRIVEPYAVGEARDGRTVLVAWQVSGGSESGPALGWHTFDLDGIVGLDELADPFVPSRVLEADPFMGRPQAACSWPLVSRT